MNRFTYFATLVGMLLAASHAFGHGRPIHLEVADDKLVVSAGATDPEGFANQLYFETDSTGDPEDVDTFSGFGMAAYWTVPGLDVFGLSENSGLYLEVLARPVKDVVPTEQRLLWYWNPTTEEVELAPATQMQIRKSPSVNILLTPDVTVAPPPIKIAAPVAADMGYHNHNLLRYLLPFPLPQSGAYGFFARLTSDVYGPSDPFLVVLNNGVAFNKMTAAALAINAAAFLPGDFNHDGEVDAADYTVWRDGLGNGYTEEQYDLWKSHFGQSDNIGGAGSVAVLAPEPTGAMLGVLHFVAFLLSRGMLRCRTNHKTVQSREPSL